MGAELLQLLSFRTTIERCATVLKPLGLDLLSILSHKSAEPFHDPTVSMTSITAIQVALVDFLRTLKVPVDGIIGYGTGEIGCAYADGCITLEQAMLIVYHIGLSIRESELPLDSTVEVGLSLRKAE
ncbi:hypothetical protein RvY_02466 [Ramazzottius varieornatus]|uniref:Malonyl-CoA:ACP transacylase (MAT) domain-containing protein n=1 Tax=Ramazzottius varieornatus TaxID=947166 RepID=A0A1D1UQN3_RAMVA|nr:hypothetical protein RvY_02466 [Ramazzottius varieornatus]